MIKIYTFADKRPDFIELQNKLFKKFVNEEYEFIVVNAASSVDLKKQIFSICKELKISVLDYPFLNTFSPQPACSKPIQWCWDNFVSNDNKNISVIIDSDMFMLQNFNFSNYIKNYDICGDYDKRGVVNYIWNGLMFFSPNLINKTEMNFSEGLVESYSTDVGGNLYHFFKKYNINVKHIENIGYIHSRNNNVHLLPDQIKSVYQDSYLCEFFEQTFFHYRAGSNWNNKNQEYHAKKSNMLLLAIDLALTDKLTIPINKTYKFHELDNWWEVEWPQEITEFTRYINGKWVK